MVEEWTKFALQEYAKSGEEIAKTKWVKTIFFIEAYNYCKDQKRKTELSFVKMPAGPAFFNYDTILNEIALKGLITLQRTPGYQTVANTYVKLNPGAKALGEIPEEIVRICKFFSGKTAQWISNFSHDMDIYTKSTMWQDLNFDLLLDDNGLQKKYSGKKNILELIDSVE